MEQQEMTTELFFLTIVSHRFFCSPVNLLFLYLPRPRPSRTILDSQEPSPQLIEIGNVRFFHENSFHYLLRFSLLHSTTLPQVPTRPPSHRIHDIRVEALALSTRGRQFYPEAGASLVWRISQPTQNQPTVLPRLDRLKHWP